MEELSVAWAGPASTLTHVTGPRGIGKTSLVAEAARGVQLLHLHCPPLPGPTQCRVLTRDLEVGAGGNASRSEVRDVEVRGADDPLLGSGDWPDFFEAVRNRAIENDRPLILVLDDAHRLTEARARIGPALAELLSSVTKAGRRIHVVLVGRGGGLPEPTAKGAVEVATRIVLGPLTAREAAPLLPGTRPASLIRSYAVFGGAPARLRLLDPEVSVGTNLRRLVLTTDGRLAREGLDVLEWSVQAPSRYVAILRALAGGEADWSTVHGGVSDLTKSGQVAPYLARLVELGLVEVRRSLDAGAGSRNRRYRIRDPYLQFWFRFVLDHLERLASGAGTRLWSDRIKPAIDSHIETIFPLVCRQYMRVGAEVIFGANARESGSLWGRDYDLSVSGLLASGGAFHGKSTWTQPADVKMVQALDGEIRETRYGFGRERRLRVIFSRDQGSRALERVVARRENLVLVGPEDLMG